MIKVNIEKFNKAVISVLEKHCSIVEIKQKFCSHHNTTEIFREYQDNYIKEKCDSCEKIIYSGIDDFS